MLHTIKFVEPIRSVVRPRCCQATYNRVLIGNALLSKYSHYFLSRGDITFVIWSARNMRTHSVNFFAIKRIQIPLENQNAMRLMIILTEKKTNKRCVHHNMHLIFHYVAIVLCNDRICKQIVPRMHPIEK